jgi:hypothetical protein
MEARQEALDAIRLSITNAKEDIGLNTFRWAEDTTAIKADELPCIFLGVGDDPITGYSNRGYLGYPATRMAQVIVELVVESGTDLKTMFEKLRKAILENYQTSDTSAIRELRTIGPTGYNVPGVKGVSLILGLRYIDTGF